MDPASALATVNGIYEEGISREKAFREILKAVYEKGYEKSKNEKRLSIKRVRNRKGMQGTICA